MRVAAVSWKLRHVRSDGKFYAHMYDLISEAHERGAELVVLPELICVELLSLAPDLEEKDVARFLVQFGKEIEGWIQRISHSSGMMLVGGSHFRETETGIVHASVTATPDRKTTITVKNNISAYEKEKWQIEPGSGLNIARNSNIGVILGRDCRNPGAWQGLVAEGAQIICVPSHSSTSDDFIDIRLACKDGATKSGAFALQASLVGGLGYQPVVSSYGSSAILSPFQGILDETELHEEGVAVTDLELESLDKIDRNDSGDGWSVYQDE